MFSKSVPKLFLSKRMSRPKRGLKSAWALWIALAFRDSLRTESLLNLSVKRCYLGDYVVFGMTYVPAPSKAHPVILCFLLNHFVLSNYNWNKMQRRVRCSVGWHNSPAFFLLALRTLAGNLVQSRCHQWLRCSKEEEISGTRRKCRGVMCVYSSQVLGITSRDHQELLVYPILGKQSEQWKSHSSTALWGFSPLQFLSA